MIDFGRAKDKLLTGYDNLNSNSGNINVNTIVTATTTTGAGSGGGNSNGSSRRSGYSSSSSGSCSGRSIRGSNYNNNNIDNDNNISNDESQKVCKYLLSYDLTVEEECGDDKRVGEGRRKVEVVRVNKSDGEKKDRANDEDEIVAEEEEEKEKYVEEEGEKVGEDIEDVKKEGEEEEEEEENEELEERVLFAGNTGAKGFACVEMMITVKSVGEKDKENIRERIKESMRAKDKENFKGRDKENLKGNGLDEIVESADLGPDSGLQLSHPWSYEVKTNYNFILTIIFMIKLNNSDNDTNSCSNYLNI